MSDLLPFPTVYAHHLNNLEKAILKLIAYAQLSGLVMLITTK